MCSTTDAREVLQDFTDWLYEHGQRGFLGEFAGADNEACDQAISGALQYMSENDAVWLGWTWWAAGPWWGDYMFSIEPEGATDKPQMSVLEPYL